MARKLTQSAVTPYLDRDVRFRVHSGDKWQVGHVQGLDGTDSTRVLIAPFDENPDGSPKRPVSHKLLRRGAFIPGVEIFVLTPPTN